MQWPNAQGGGRSAGAWPVCADFAAAPAPAPVIGSACDPAGAAAVVTELEHGLEPNLVAREDDFCKRHCLQ